MENIPQTEVRVDQKVLEDFLFSTETKLTDQHKRLFFALAIRNQLDPFRREIHAIPYKNNQTGKTELSIVTGYEVYLKRAERSGQLDGWKCTTEGTGDSLKAKIVIHRKDWKEPFEHEVTFREYNLKRGLWMLKPETMLKKVAMAQGFRLAFPEELGGMPYTSDELDSHDVVDTNPIEEKTESQPEKPTDEGRALTPLQGQNNFLEEMKRYKVKVGQVKFGEILTGRYSVMKPEEVNPEDQPGILKELEEAYQARTAKEKK